AEPGRGQAQVWEVKTGRPVGRPLRHAQTLTTAQVSPDGRSVLTAGKGGAFVWDLEKGTVQWQNPVPAGWLAVYSPDGTRVGPAPGRGGPPGGARPGWGPRGRAGGGRRRCRTAASSGGWLSAGRAAACSRPGRAGRPGSGTRPGGSRCPRRCGTAVRWRPA